MAILEKEVLVTHSPMTVEYYESIGYEFPKYKNKKGKLMVKKGTQILVKIEDLKKGSNAKVTKICDVEGCGKHIPNQTYKAILEYRELNKEGIDRCNECSSRENGIKRGVANIETCVATTHPEFAKLFWNEEDTNKFTYSSNKKVDFKCQKCQNKIESKIIGNVYNKGIMCPYCSDGLSYPEKFMYSLLSQIGIGFSFQKIFNWSNKKKYDFYISSLNCIIETHGGQHYKYTGRGRSLKEEKENDRIKESLAKENKINKYIIIDCRESEFEWIKNSILNSQLNGMFDLSNVDLLSCHEYTCNSLVKTSSDLWNEGITIIEISEILKLDKTTIVSYLKKGTKLKWCRYDPKEEMRKSAKSNRLDTTKKVVQLAIDGKLMLVWDKIKNAEENLQITNISKVCRGITKTAGGYRWMYKEDYDKINQ